MLTRLLSPFLNEKIFSDRGSMLDFFAFVFLSIVAIFLSYILFYKSVRKKYSKIWSIINIATWGVVFIFLFAVIYFGIMRL